jgi:hypothetical protein
MFLHRNSHKFTSPDGKTRNQIDYILIVRRQHSSVHNMRSFKAADSGTNPIFFSNKARGRLAVSKQSIELIYKVQYKKNKNVIG